MIIKSHYIDTIESFNPHGSFVGIFFGTTYEVDTYMINKTLQVDYSRYTGAVEFGEEKAQVKFKLFYYFSIVT